MLAFKFIAKLVTNLSYVKHLGFKPPSLPIESVSMKV